MRYPPVPILILSLKVQPAVKPLMVIGLSLYCFAFRNEVRWSIWRSNFQFFSCLSFSRLSLVCCAMMQGEASKKRKSKRIHECKKSPACPAGQLQQLMNSKQCKNPLYKTKILPEQTGTIFC